MIDNWPTWPTIGVKIMRPRQCSNTQQGVYSGMKVASWISLDLICEHQLNLQWWKYSNFNNSCIACLNITKSSLNFEVSCMNTKHKKPLCEQKDMWTNIRLNKQHHGTQQKTWHMNMITFPIGRTKFICQEQNPVDHFAKFICSVLETVNASSIAIRRVFQYKFSSHLCLVLQILKKWGTHKYPQNSDPWLPSPKIIELNLSLNWGSKKSNILVPYTTSSFMKPTCFVFFCF
jgi:hypothetical protein